MGDATSDPIRLSFNPQLRVEFRGATVTSDVGLLLPRELDERLGLSALIEQHLTDPRTGHNRQPHPTCPVLHPAAGRKPLDEDPLSADSPAHRATRMAPHVIEKAGPGGREKRSTLSGSISRPDGRREQTFGRRAVSLAGAAGTAHVTPSERQRGLVARHVVCSATGGSEDLGPNRKSRLKREQAKLS